MLEGREISIVLKSRLDKIQDRLDSEFYQKKFIEYGEILNRQGFKTLEEWGAQLDCSAFYPAITDYYNFDGQGIPFIRVNEIQDGMVQITKSTAFLPKSILDLNTKTIAKAYPNDIIIAKGGNTLAKVGIVTDEYPEYAVCRDVIILRTHNIPENVRYYIWAFMHSNYGYEAMVRTASQTGQPHLILPFVTNLEVPFMSELFFATIKKLYNKAIELQNSSLRIYEEASKLINKELNYVYSHVSSSLLSNSRIQTFSKSLFENNRIDAEYYQTEYDDYLKIINGYHNGAEGIGRICDIQEKNFSPESERIYKYIELSDIGKYGNIEGYTENKGIELPTRARRKVSTNDVIVSSIEGSLDSCALITEDYNEALCSTGFHIVRSSFFYPETLLLLFKSKPIQMLMKKGCSGTILTAIGRNELEKIPLPLITKDIQEQIAKYVKEGSSLRNKSKQLLELVKQTVEIAINENEEEALKYINEIEKG